MANFTGLSPNSHDFCLVYGEGDQQRIYFHLLKFDHSFFLWIGATATLKDICLSMPNMDENDKTLSRSCKLLGDKSDTFGEYLAAKLSKKTNLQVFVSSNLSTAADDPLKRNVEMRIFEELKNLPEKFLWMIFSVFFIRWNIFFTYKIEKNAFILVLIWSILVIKKQPTHIPKRFQIEKQQ